ncbi:hypothetical protein [Streptomyces sp. NPDC091371]|uniref:hypothetical protein n=1 Tax=Streptomyces sp. NPDC091371 TaxID=3155303 RepID=UPI003414BE75
MPRRLPLSLRAWSGALLVWAIFACLTGLARPAVAMGMPMPMSMSMSMPAPAPEPQAVPGAMAMTESGPGAMAGPVAGEPAHGADCPAADQQCAAPKVTLGHDVPTAQVPSAASAAAASAPRVRAAWPHAPPPDTGPPDLHRLCVSRT